LQLPRDPFAVTERHPGPAAALGGPGAGAHAVDEDPQLPPVVRKLDVDELVPQPDGRRFNDLANVHNPRHKQKMGARPIP